jgi:Ca-activated chloride channel family protein
MSSEPVVVDAASRAAAKEHVARLAPGGGTNIHDALLEALRQRPAEGAMPMCLFLTDGLPTIGRTIEREIRALAETGNPSKRRIFTVGIGPDLNVPLLDRIADASRALATYVTPGADLTATVADLGERLAGPVIAEIALGSEESGRSAPGRIAEQLPATLPDLFRGSTLVVLGQYRGDAPFTLSIAGQANVGAGDSRRSSIHARPRRRMPSSRGSGPAGASPN